MGKRKKGKGKSAKKAAAGQSGPGATRALDKSPHTFVFQRGLVGKNVRELLSDMRAVMEPFTASHLKVRKKNVLKDFVNVAGLLHVSHFMIFTKTESTVNLRVCRLPHGPTLHFRVMAYSLRREVVSSMRKQHSMAHIYEHHPLLVVNGLSGEGLHFKLMASMFQNMFPSIDVSKVKLSTVRRCVLLNYDQDSGCLEFRHYNIRVVPIGMSRGVKKLLRKRKDVPNLSTFEDLTDFMSRTGDMSESEAELDGPDNEVTVATDVNTGPVKPGKSAIRLTEIGPRLRLKLVKIDEGFCSGNVLYHNFVEKTEADLLALKKFKAEKKKLKDQRRRVQDTNVRNKKEKKEMVRLQTMAGMKRTDTHKEGSTAGAVEEDDDVEYYKQEVGEEPDKELFLKTKSKFKVRAGSKRPNAGDKPFVQKRARLNSGGKQSDGGGGPPWKRGRDGGERKFGGKGAKNGKFDGGKGRGQEGAAGGGKKAPKTDLERIKLRKKKKMNQQKNKVKRKPGAAKKRN